MKKELQLNMPPNLKNSLIFWFRRDLRLEDNCGLTKALNQGLPVVPLFIFDKNILDELDKNDKRVSFLHNRITELDEELRKYDSGLWVAYENPSDFFAGITDCKGVYTNEDYEPYAINRDEEISKILSQKGIPFHLIKDQLIFAKKEVLKPDGNPYTVYTPYSRKWKEHFSEDMVKPFETSYPNLSNKPASEIPSLKEMGFEKVEFYLKELNLNNDLLENYDDIRDVPSKNGTSNLSVALRFGLISIREAYRRAKKNQSLINELIWREFFSMILYNFPSVVENNFRRKYDAVPWRNDKEDFERWCNGETGYPMVDAGMRELNETGYMHNRVRMVVAGFLTKHLLIHWSWGEAYFASKLMDYELASNNGNWQWAAGTGCDAAPYFRIFNPESQIKKFDKKYSYIKQWVNDIDTSDYPSPMVEHKFARQRALDAFNSIKE